MTNQTNNYLSTIFIFAILFLIWGILGMLDAKNYTNSGYGTDGNNTIIQITEGGAAELAGLEVGDEIVSTGGISVTDTKALVQRDRPKIGETREFVVNRGGEEMSFQLTYQEMSSKNRSLNWAGFIIGLLFILFGVYAHNKIRSNLSLAFAVFALCFGFIFLGGPYISSPFLGQVVGSVATTVVLFSFTALAIFMLKYPPESKFLESKNSKRLLYIPLIILTLIIWILNLVQPDSSSTLNTVMRLLFGVYIIFYFLVALITLFNKFRRADATMRSSTGLNMMLVGAIIGLLPILIYFSISVISPATILPGNDYVFLTFAAIPIFFTIGLQQLHSNAE